jgi:hypothetical protein
MNFHAVQAIYRYEMARTGRTLFQSVVSPVISTSLYFIVFGAAIGSRITQIEGVSYGAFIVPGLIMLMLLTQSVTNAAFGIYFPRFVGTIYELLSAPVVVVRNRTRLCGRSDDQIGHFGRDHPGDVVAVRAAADRSSGVDGGFPYTDFYQLQPVRVHSWAVGKQLREAANSTAADPHPADVSWRHVLFHQRIAANSGAP